MLWGGTVPIHPNPPKIEQISGCWGQLRAVFRREVAKVQPLPQWLTLQVRAPARVDQAPAVGQEFLQCFRQLEATWCQHSEP